MRRHIFTLLAVGAALGFALLYRFPSGLGTTVLRSEKTFDAQLMNSINRIARAKSEWAAWDSKPALHTPSMGDLHRYLGAATNSIQQLESWGVRYTLTPASQEMSDTATLTRDIYFQAGIARFYPTGTTYSMAGGWRHPSNFRIPLLVRVREWLIERRMILGVVIIGSVMYGLALVACRKWRLNARSCA
jgi:hypothetical protein